MMFTIMARNIQKILPARKSTCLFPYLHSVLFTLCK